jgi:vacuolar-type H+-ATPase subunit E/Vma4
MKREPKPEPDLAAMNAELVALFKRMEDSAAETRKMIASSKALLRDRRELLRRKEKLK